MKISKSLPTNLKLHREFKVILNYICWINRTINITIYQNKCKLNIKITRTFFRFAIALRFSIT